MPKYISGEAFFTTPFDTAIVREDLLSQDESRQIAALHHILAFMTTGKDMTSVYNEVAPLTSSASIRLKRLSYLYMMHNSRSFAEKAVLQAGTFVKDSLHDSALMRGAALRTMTSLQLRVMADFVNGPIRRGVKDDSPYVRHAAVLGILKQYLTAPNITLHAGLLQELHGLLFDSSAVVVGGVIHVMYELQLRGCPVQFAPVIARAGAHFMELLPNASEWSLEGLISGLAWSLEYTSRLLAREQEHVYKRLQRVNRSSHLTSKKKETHEEDRNNDKEQPHHSEEKYINEWHKRLVVKWSTFVNDGKTIAQTLCKYLMFDNIAVILATIKAIGVYIFTIRYLSKILQKQYPHQVEVSELPNEPHSDVHAPEEYEEEEEEQEHELDNKEERTISTNATSSLLSLHECHEIWERFAAELGNALRTLTKAPRHEVQFVAYRFIEKCVVDHRSPLREYFRDYLTEFVIWYDEPVYIKLSKLAILTSLCNETSGLQVLEELMVYVTDNDAALVEESIYALGSLAIRLPELTWQCVQYLIKLITSHEPHIVEQCILVVQRIVQRFPGKFEGVIPVLCGAVRELTTIKPRVAIVWMLGEYTEHIPHAIDDFLTLLVDDFATSPEEVQLALLTTMMKVYVKCEFKGDHTQIEWHKSDSSNSSSSRNSNSINDKNLNNDDSTTNDVVNVNNQEEEKCNAVKRMLEESFNEAYHSLSTDVQERAIFYRRLLQNYSIQFVKNVLFAKEKKYKTNFDFINHDKMNNNVDNDDNNNNTAMDTITHIVNLSDVTTAQMNVLHERKNTDNNDNNSIDNNSANNEINDQKKSNHSQRQIESLQEINKNHSSNANLNNGISYEIDYEADMKMLHEAGTIEWLMTNLTHNNNHDVSNTSMPHHINETWLNYNMRPKDVDDEWLSALISTKSSSAINLESELSSTISSESSASESELESQSQQEKSKFEQEKESLNRQQDEEELANKINKLHVEETLSHKATQQELPLQETTSPKLVKSDSKKDDTSYKNKSSVSKNERGPLISVNTSKTPYSRNVAQSRVTRSINPHSHAGETIANNYNNIHNLIKNNKEYLIVLEPNNTSGVKVAMRWSQEETNLLLQCRFALENKKIEEEENKILSQDEMSAADYLREVSFINVQINRNMFGLGISEPFRTIYLHCNDEEVEASLKISVNNETRPTEEIEVAIAMEPLGVRYTIAPPIPPILLLLPAINIKLQSVINMVETTHNPTWELPPQVNELYVDSSSISNTNTLRVYGFTFVIGKELKLKTNTQYLLLFAETITREKMLFKVIINESTLQNVAVYCDRIQVANYFGNYLIKCLTTEE